MPVTDIFVSDQHSLANKFRAEKRRDKKKFGQCWYLFELKWGVNEYTCLFSLQRVQVVSRTVNMCGREIKNTDVRKKVTRPDRCYFIPSKEKCSVDTYVTLSL